MSDIIRLDKVLIGLIKEFKELELADRQKDLHELEVKLSDSDNNDRFIRNAAQMVNDWESRKEKDVIQYALISAIHEINFRNHWT